MAHIARSLRSKCAVQRTAVSTGVGGALSFKIISVPLSILQQAVTASTSLTQMITTSAHRITARIRMHLHHARAHRTDVTTPHLAFLPSSRYRRASSHTSSLPYVLIQQAARPDQVSSGCEGDAGDGGQHLIRHCLTNHLSLELRASCALEHAALSIGQRLGGLKLLPRAERRVREASWSPAAVAGFDPARSQ